MRWVLSIAEYIAHILSHASALAATCVYQTMYAVGPGVGDVVANSLKHAGMFANLAGEEVLRFHVHRAGYIVVRAQMKL